MRVGGLQSFVLYESLQQQWLYLELPRCLTHTVQCQF